MTRTTKPVRGKAKRDILATKPTVAFCGNVRCGLYQKALPSPNRLNDDTQEVCETCGYRLARKQDDSKKETT